MRLVAVIVHYETPDATRAAVAALRASRRPLDGILVVDNGSVAAPHAGDAEILTLPANLGFGGGANHGIRAALAGGAGRVLVVNSDARVAPDAIAALEAALAERPGLAGPTIVGSDGRIESRGIDYSPHTGRVRCRDAGQPATPAHASIAVDAVSGCVLLADRAALDAAGLFDEAYFYAFEDLDLCRRVRAAGFQVSCVPAAVAVHDGSLTIGAASPRRVYFATRNHLRFAAAAGPPWSRPLRELFVVGLNLLHVAVRPPAPRLASALSVSRGVRDYLLRRFGAGD